ncbi:NAD(P)/FAD-dependent oxidoreductase [Streptomyces sp. NPDC046237]|uniref:flavin monoamine oxidase family protein n=1 Tax=Streptomyces sp. NPDC046237 TaxID=3154914 RepID=UPI0033C8B6B1
MNPGTASTSPDPERRIERRGLLKAAAATALTAGALATAAPVAAASTGRTAATPRSVDAVVIGAGYAGVTAARELAARGLRPVVLEARDRIGGRTWTTQFAGEQIELGGAWVSDLHPLVMAELKRYGIRTVAGGGPPERSFYPTPGGPREFDAEEAGARLGDLMTKLFEGSERYFERPYEPLHRKDLLETVDRLSLRDRLAQMRLSAQDELWLSGVTASQSGGSSSYGALTALAQWWALSGWNMEGWDGLVKYRPEGGMVRLLEAILGDAHAELRLDSPVARIADEGRRVVVTTRAGERFSAATVVVAVPVNSWRTIDFRPGLPKVHRQATTQRVGVPYATKLWVRLDGSVGRVYAAGAEGYPFSTVIPHTELPGGDQLVIAFSHDPLLDPNSKRQVEAGLRHLIPDAKVVDLVSQDWGRDPFSQGAWGMRQPGQLLAQLPDIQRPQGRIAFATGDIATGWNGGFIDGAIESGLLAAQQAADAA